MKKDLYNDKRRFKKWLAKTEKNRCIKGLNRVHSKFILNFIKDFMIGINVAKTSKKGERSIIRLNKLKQKVIFLLRLVEKRNIKDVRKISDKELHQIFNDMKTGKISTRFGTPYKSTGDYIKDFKTFWHWYQKIMRKRGKMIADVTEDLDTRGEKPRFIYFTKDDLCRIITEARFDLKPVLALAYDSGMRVTELLNTKVSDFDNDYKELNIREEVSKTFGRKIKLMLCSKQIREYVNKIGLTSEDFFIRLSHAVINKELRKIGRKILSPRQLKYKNLALYDFRHSSACFWLPKYKSESALKYRFGWKKSDMIHYYTEFLGMKDTITQDDLYDDITKADLEKEVDNLKKKYDKLFSAIKRINDALSEKHSRPNKLRSQ
jgi:integrase